MDVDLWAYWNHVTLDFSRPGKPTDDAYIESFNGRFRQECLSEHRFLSLDDDQDKVEAWRKHYNEKRPPALSAMRPRRNTQPMQTPEGAS
jgi:putative transposase